MMFHGSSGRANPLALRERLPDRWGKSHPEHVMQFRRAGSAHAAQRRRQQKK